LHRLSRAFSKEGRGRERKEMVLEYKEAAWKLVLA